MNLDGRVYTSIWEKYGELYPASGSQEGKEISWWYISNMVNYNSIFPTPESCNGIFPINSKLPEKKKREVVVVAVRSLKITRTFYLLCICIFWVAHHLLRSEQLFCPPFIFPRCFRYLHEAKILRSLFLLTARFCQVRTCTREQKEVLITWEKKLIDEMRNSQSLNSIRVEA